MSGPLEVKQLLACLALSPRARAIAGETVALGRLFGAKVALVHAGQDTPETREGLRSALGYEGADDEPEVIVRPGRADEVICEAAAERNADLVVAGALEKEGLFEGLIGSVARRIARNAPCSVVLVPAPKPAGNPYRRIVVSAQLDPASHEMIAFSLDMARRANAAFFHIVREMEPSPGVSPLDTHEEERDAERRLWLSMERSNLADFVNAFDFSGLDLSMTCIEGTEGVATVGYARRQGADLLVYPSPSRRLTFWDRFFRHPSNNILERLPCALLLYRGGASA